MNGLDTPAADRFSSGEPRHEELVRLAPMVAAVVARLCSREPWTYWPTTAESWGPELRARWCRLVGAVAHRSSSARARDPDHANVCDVQRTSRDAADTQVLAPAAVVRALLRPRGIGRRHGGRDEIDLEHTAELVQPAADTLSQPEVSDPLTGNPDDRRRAPMRRLRAGRIAAVGADEPASEHDQICRRIGCSGGDRSRLQPVLSGMLRGRNYERRLDASVIQPARRVLADRNELRQRQRSLSLPRVGGSRRDRNPDAGARRRQRDRDQPAKRWKTVHGSYPRVSLPLLRSWVGSVTPSPGSAPHSSSSKTAPDGVAWTSTDASVPIPATDAESGTNRARVTLAMRSSVSAALLQGRPTRPDG
jgi:hypothetical protein